MSSKEIKLINRKGNQAWIFIGRTDAEAEAPVLWPPDVKSWLIGKDPDAGKDWRQQEKGMTEDEMVAWHHWLNGHEFEQALGVGDEQGSLMSCSPWGYKESDATEWLNLTEMFDFDLEQLSDFSVPDLCYLQNGSNDTTCSILMMKYRIPEGWNILLNVPEQVAPRIPEWSSWHAGRKMDGCAAGTCPSALCLHLSWGAQVSPHLTFQRLYISCEIMRCGMEAGRIYRAVKCSLV